MTDAAGSRTDAPDAEARGMAALVEALDWSATPLGPRERWPQSLRTTVDIMLTSRFAMWMGWGPELTFLYNDAYRPTLGVKHPWALGAGAREVWGEIWADIGPRIRTVMDTGRATWDEALLLFLARSGYVEETYHTFSYSPLKDDEGVVAGMLCVVSEETERVIGERRLASLRELASELAGTSLEEDVLAAVARKVGANQRDLPFTLTYLFDDGGRARLACRTGIETGHPAAPTTIDARDPDAPWPVAGLLERSEPIVVRDLASRFGPLPTGAWERPPHTALVVPITQRAHERPAGFLVAGMNPHRPIAPSYAGFVALIAGQIASGLANARAYEEERRRAESLAELDRAKTAFFSNVSHEFRTPLTLLLAPIEDALRRGEGVAPGVRAELEVAHRNALRLLKLVNTLLDFSRIEAGRIDAAYEPIDLAAYTAELASSFRSAVEREGIALVVDAPPLPGDAPPAYVDRDMWEKIVLNLMSNAFKHTFAGEITVRVRAEHGAARLEVRDSGVGIPAADLPRIFERFHRVSNARSRTHEGTGIGLALVQELVRRHGGTIAVESTEGVGSAFSISIPLGAAHLPRDRVADAGPTHAPRATSLGAAPYVEEAARWGSGLGTGDSALADPSAAAPMVADVGATSAESPVPSPASRILLADDNADMREYVARLLRDAGWEVEAVADGRAALDAARARRPDLVLSDVMMPGLDGFQLLAALREDAATRAIPVVLLSARAGEEARVEGVRSGADDYVVKPFSAQELVARVGAQIALARERARATHAVEEARSQLERVFEQAPVGIAVLEGPELVFTLANQPYRAFVGGRDVVGRRIRDALPELEGQGIYELLERVHRTGEPFTAVDFRARLAMRDGESPEERVFDFTYQPLRRAGGAVYAVAVVALDVTEQVRSREAVDAARREAEAASRAKSEFLAVMSHELRTPLNAIAGHVQLIEMGIHGPVTDEQRAALDRIERNQRHLLGLINDVLNFARVEMGRVEYAIEDVSVREVAESLAPMIEPQLAVKGLGYAVSLEEPPVIVRADRERLAQILLNLLSNAIKFTPAGGRITLDVAARDAMPGTAFIRVSDTGEGIPRDKQASIFEPFVQVDTSRTRTRDGVGLGLAISRDLARGMGGDLRVRSVEGEGSTFTLALPRGGERA